MTASTTDLYRYCRALNLTPPATAAEVKQAYRDMVLIWHPDRFTANPRLQKRAEARMREINEAYAALRDGVNAQAARPGEPRRDTPPPPPTPAPTPRPWARRAAAAGLQVFTRRLAALYQSIPLPARIPRTLLPVLFAAAIVTAFIFGSVWLLESIPSVQTPFESIGPAPLRYRLSTMLAALTWRYRVATPAAPPPKPTPASAADDGSGHRQRSPIPPATQDGVDLIVPHDVRGVGVLRIRNAADLDAAVTLTGAQSGKALRLVYVRSGEETRIAGIGPGEYMLHARFGRRWNPSTRTFAELRSEAVAAGPFVYVQVQGTGGIRSDEYEVTFTPRQ